MAMLDGGLKQWQGAGFDIANHLNEWAGGERSLTAGGTEMLSRGQRWRSEKSMAEHCERAWTWALTQLAGRVSELEPPVTPAHVKQ